MTWLSWLEVGRVSGTPGWMISWLDCTGNDGRYYFQAHLRAWWDITLLMFHCLVWTDSPTQAFGDWGIRLACLWTKSTFRVVYHIVREIFGHVNQFLFENQPFELGWSTSWSSPARTRWAIHNYFLVTCGVWTSFNHPHSSGHVEPSCLIACVFEFVPNQRHRNRPMIHDIIIRWRKGERLCQWFKDTRHRIWSDDQLGSIDEGFSCIWQMGRYINLLGSTDIKPRSRKIACQFGAVLSTIAGGKAGHTKQLHLPGN